VGNLWEGLAENRWLNPTNTALAMANANEGTVLNSASNFPGGITTETKGGSKSAVCTDTGWFNYNGETIVYNVLAKDTTIPCNGAGSIRTIFSPAFGYQILRAMGSDLEVTDSTLDAAAAPSTLRPGDSLAFFANISNVGGADAGAFDVDFRLSTNTTYGTLDTALDTKRSAPITGFSDELVVSNAIVPGITPGTYYLVWNVDSNGEVPEFLETTASNRGFWPTPITVQAQLEPIDDFVFTASTSGQWDAIVDAASYRIYQGVPAALTELAGSGLDSCRLEIVTSPVASGTFSATPPSGSFYWYLIAAENDGPLLPGSAGARSLDSTGECAASCAHPKCELGVALEPACDLCVAWICDIDPFCCETSWDSVCQSEVRTICGSLTCPESAGACDHPVCSEGTALVADCDSPPLTTSCVSAICAADSFCCTGTWDSLCTGAVASVCNATCE
jgi:hypothetical protein